MNLQVFQLNAGELRLHVDMIGVLPDIQRREAGARPGPSTGAGPAVEQAVHLGLELLQRGPQVTEEIPARLSHDPLLRSMMSETIAHTSRGRARRRDGRIGFVCCTERYSLPTLQGPCQYPRGEGHAKHACSKSFISQHLRHATRDGIAAAGPNTRRGGGHFGRERLPDAVEVPGFDIFWMLFLE